MFFLTKKSIINNLRSTKTETLIIMNSIKKSKFKIIFIILTKMNF